MSLRKSVRVFLCAAVLLAFTGTVRAQEGGFVRIIGSRGPIHGDATDPAHQGWISFREASMPSVSEITSMNEAGVGQNADSTRGPISRQTAGNQPHSSAADSTSSTTAKTKGQTGANSGADVYSPTDAASGQVSGKRMHKPFVIVKEIDKTSPLLTQAAASGELLREVDIALYRQENGKEIPVGNYKLTNATITSIQRTSLSSGGDRPMESVSFNYQKIEVDRR